MGRAIGEIVPYALGAALAELKMLTGQVYLVTVIGIVVGNFAGRRTARDEQAQSSLSDPEEIWRA